MKNNLVQRSVLEPGGASPMIKIFGAGRGKRAEEPKEGEVRRHCADKSRDSRREHVVFFHCPKSVIFRGRQKENKIFRGRPRRLRGCTVRSEAKSHFCDRRNDRKADRRNDRKKKGGEGAAKKRQPGEIRIQKELDELELPQQCKISSPLQRFLSSS